MNWLKAVTSPRARGEHNEINCIPEAVAKNATTYASQELVLFESSVYTPPWNNGVLKQTPLLDIPGFRWGVGIRQ